MSVAPFIGVFAMGPSLNRSAFQRLHGLHRVTEARSGMTGSRINFVILEGVLGQAGGWLGSERVLKITKFG